MNLRQLGRCGVIVAVTVAPLAGMPAWAQNAEPERIRGVLASVEKSLIVVRGSDNKTGTIKIQQ